MEIKHGFVEIKTPFDIKEFDGDMGWIKIHIPVGTYEYRIKDINGWMPQQILLDGIWQDLAGACKEINELMGW